MKIKTTNEENPIRDGALQVLKRLRAAGFTAYFAGGCVRDEILGKTPKDYDIASNAQPEEVEALFDHTHALGKAFGIIQVMIDGHGYEVARFRRDLDYQDGRHPGRVEPSTPEEDAQRRDFTINGMFMDPMDGRIIDFVGGLQDLDLKILRAIGDPRERFQEDFLRMLRAVRFASTLEFPMDPGTRNAVQEFAAQITRISAERIEQECTRILTESPRPGDALQLLQDTGLLKHLMPELLPLMGQEQPPQFHPEGDVWTHTKIMLNMMRHPNRQLAWSVLFHDIGKPATAAYATGNDGVYRIRFNGHDAVGATMAESIMRRLKFSNADREVIKLCVANHMKYGQVQNMRQATLRKIVASPTFEIEMELHRVDCLSSHGGLDNYQTLMALKEAYAAEPVLPPPLVTGRDLMALGMPPSPQLGVWKKAAFEYQLEHPELTREELMEWVRQEADRP